MSELITQYANTEKKLKIRIEKLLATLFLSKFTGTVTGITPNEQFNIVISAEEKSYTDKSIMSLASLIDSTLFTLKTEIPEGYKINYKEYESLDLIFKIVENIDRSHITALLKPVAAEHFSIRPEAGKLVFLYNELEPFIGQKRIEIFSNFKKHYRTIFFLLLTRFASVIKSTDEERVAISKMLGRSNMFDDKTEDEVIEEDIGETKDQKLASFLDVHEKFKDVFHLFGLNPGFEEKFLHKEYLRIVQRTHPDKLRDVSSVNRERAEKFFRTVSENYELLRNPDERAEIEKLSKKYGPIKSRTDYTRMKEYDEAIFKGVALSSLGNFEAAAEVFHHIFEQTKNPEALERKINAIWKKSSKWNDFEKSIQYPAIKDDVLKLTTITDVDIETLFILAEIYEFLKLIPDCMKTLSIITKIQPDNFKANGMKKRLVYYQSLEKQGKK